MKISKVKFDIFRANKRLKLEDLAKSAGVARVLLSKIGKENVEFRPVTVGKIAKALGVSVEEIIDIGE